MGIWVWVLDTYLHAGDVCGLAAAEHRDAGSAGAVEADEARLLLQSAPVRHQSQFDLAHVRRSRHQHKRHRVICMHLVCRRLLSGDLALCICGSAVEGLETLPVLRKGEDHHHVRLRRLGISPVGVVDVDSATRIAFLNEAELAPPAGQNTSKLVADMGIKRTDLHL
jgi:hypothetical protein